MNFGILMIFAAISPLTGAADVKLGGVIGEGFYRCLNGNVLKLDLEKDFFPPFEKRDREGGFIGLGKHADAAVCFAANSKDPRAIAHKEKVIGFLIDHQLADGYTGCFKPEARIDKRWDLHEMGFIIQAFMDDYFRFGNDKALAAAKKNIDLLIDRWPQLKDNWEITFVTDRSTTLGIGYGIALYYAATKDEKYRDFLVNERSLKDWNVPIVIGRDKMIFGHSYVYLGICLEQLELYKYDHDPKYLRSAVRVLDFMVKGDGLLIDANGGVCECFTDDQDGEGEVGESCNAAFELLVWDSLLKQDLADRALLGDLMERLIYNGLFAAMSKDGRRLRYFTPLNGERRFWPDDLYCCPNNFRRAMSRLPEYVFYAEGRSLYANLYTACEGEFDLDGDKVKIVEETDYPKSGKVKFTLDAPGKRAFSFKVRVPRWVKNPIVKINGTEVPYKYAPGEILSLPKVWKKGDTVELDFPMEVRTVLGRKRQSGRFAVMRGPVVYAMNTHELAAFKTADPHYVQTQMMVDPTQLKYSEKDGTIVTAASTKNWSVGITALTVDDVKDQQAVDENVNVVQVRLRPFADEDVNLTYFRAPNIKEDCREGDELFAR